MLRPQEGGLSDPLADPGRIHLVAIDGFDVIGQAKTGTGKTAALRHPADRDARGRGNVGRRGSSSPIFGELVQQIVAGSARRAPTCPSAGSMAASRSRRSCAPTRGVDIVVGTPGRVIDHRAEDALSRRYHARRDSHARHRVPPRHRARSSGGSPTCTRPSCSATISADIASSPSGTCSSRSSELDGRAVGRDDQAALHHGRPRPQDRAAAAPPRSRRAPAVHRVHPHQAGADKLAERLRGRQGRRGDPRRPRPDRPQPRHAGGLPRRHHQRPGRHRRRRPRASTSTTSATSSTTTSPTTPRTTCTGSAVRN